MNICHKLIAELGDHRVHLLSENRTKATTQKNLFLFLHVSFFSGPAFFSLPGLRAQRRTCFAGGK